MKKLLIVQNLNANKGNALVMHAMKASLLKEYPEVTISMTAYDIEKAREDYRLETAEWLISFTKIVHAKTRVLMTIYFLREIFWIIYSLFWICFHKIGFDFYVPNFKKKTIGLYLNSDVVVIPAGHSFTNLNGFHLNVSHCYALLFAIWLGKKTMIYSQTVGPFFGRFGKLTEMLCNHIVNRVDLVTVREKNSYLKYSHLKNTHLTSEIVFSLEAEDKMGADVEDIKRLKATGKIVVGVTIHHIYYKHYFNKEEYTRIMSDIFDSIIEKYQCEVLIIPMETKYEHGGDRPIARKMQSIAENSSQIHILSGDFDAVTTSAIIAQTDIFIGTKTHSIVCSLRSGVPTISISYQSKSNEFMALFDVLENAINLKDMNFDRFMNIFDYVYKNREVVRKKQQDCLVGVREKALLNNKLLMTLF